MYDGKAEFPASLLRSLVSPDSSEIIQKSWFAASEHLVLLMLKTALFEIIIWKQMYLFET